MIEPLVITFFSVAGTLLFLSLIAVGLRVYVRLAISKEFLFDDYLMVTTLVFYALYQAFILSDVYLGAVKSPDKFVPIFSPAFKASYFGELFYTPSVWILRLSIGAYLFRLVQARALKLTLLATMVLSSLYCIGYFFLVLFLCAPVEQTTNNLTTNGKCVPSSAVVTPSYILSIFVGLSDIIFASISFSLIRQQQMSRTMEVFVIGLVCLGMLGGMTAFIRIPYLKELADERNLTLISTISNLMIWSCIEPGVGIIVGSLVTLRPIFSPVIEGITPCDGGETPPQFPKNACRRSIWRMPHPRRSRGIEHLLKGSSAMRDVPDGGLGIYTATFGSQANLTRKRESELRFSETPQLTDYDEDEFELGARASNLSMAHQGLSPMPPRRDWLSPQRSSFL